MNIIVFDLEATCFPEHLQISKDECEIIEIGAVKISQSDFEIVDKFNTFIKPTIHPELSSFCKSLTSIKQEDVNTAPDFYTAIRLFEKWSGDNPLYVSWGEYDRRQIIRECLKKDKINPILNKIEKHINIKKRISNITDIPKLSLVRAITECKMRFVGTAHRGIDDAINIVRIMKYYKSNLHEFDIINK